MVLLKRTALKASIRPRPLGDFEGQHMGDCWFLGMTLLQEKMK